MNATSPQSDAVLISPRDSILVCIDVQTRLMPKMGNLDQVLKNGVRLMKGAKLAEVPIVVTEQYPKGLGATVDTFLIDLPEDSIVQKTTFSAAREPAFMDWLEQRAPRKQVVLFGTEAHVCVLQTALELRAMGWSVFVVQDALSSRATLNETLAAQRMIAMGVQMVSTEMVLFEWTEGKEADHFKKMQKLIV